jgi:hypothetical protein
MGKVRLSVAVAATILGILVLLFSLMQPDRPTLGIVLASCSSPAAQFDSTSAKREGYVAASLSGNL